MVRFVSFFVGLVFGIQPVELSVSGAVARVEIRLNATTVAEIHGEPWQTSIDLGPRLRPAVLEAIAFDSKGHTLDHDVQWLNVPRPRAEATLMPELDEANRLQSVRIQWNSPEFLEPRKVKVQLDDVSLDAGAEGRIDLKNVDQSTLHLLEAEITFPDDVVVREQLVFGKGSVGSLELDLTAVPIFVDDPGENLTADRLQGMFLVDGKPAHVTDVEKGAAQLIVVRGPSVNQQLTDLERRLRKGRPNDLDDRLPDDVSVRVIGTIPNSGPRGNARLFPFSSAQPVGKKGLAADLEKARFADLEFGLRLLGDAVALAGLRAASGNQRRAVLLLLGDDPDDVSTYAAADVRSYLQELSVPLIVFDLTGGSKSAEAWRPTEDVMEPRRWMSAVRWLREDLDNQRVVWLVGKHLLRDIELSPEAKGIELLR